MRNLLMTLAVVALLAAPGWAGVKVKVESNKSSIAVSETATITVSVQADPTTVGVASLAGDVVASGTGAVTASGWAFGQYFNRVGATNFPATVPTYSGGTVLNFGSMQALTTPEDLPDETGANWGGAGAWAVFATYTVQGTTAGSVTLTFSPHWQDGFKLDDTADDQTLVSNAPVTITVSGTPNNAPVFVSITPTPALVGAGALANTFIMVAGGSTNDLTLAANFTDDGQLAPLTYTWTKVSSTPAPPPGSIPNALVSFESANSATTRVRFNRNGYYTLQCAAFDGQYTTTGQITIRVVWCDLNNSGGLVNILDRNVLNAAFGNTSNPWADLNGSGGIVNILDRNILNAAFGKTYNVAAYPADPFH